MFEDTYKTIENKAEGVFKDRGSKFIGLAIPVSTEQQTKQIIEEIRNQYHDACHHCFAYRLGYDKSAYRHSDDGEPSGTAGKPIFNQILTNDLTNVLIVVVRYFGGKLLGVSGLINAYKQAATDSINNSNIIEKIVYDYYEIKFGYEKMNEIMKLLKDHDAKPFENTFTDKYKISFKIRKNSSNNIYSKIKQINEVELTHLRCE